ncbi:MAG: hypothetical protein KC561_07570 [Myxococcales bacterium]|nr:hypothetical protein [Myxococcales bacterium]
MKKRTWTRILGLLLLAGSLTGCFGQTQTRGARSLIPLMDEDSDEIWVYIDTDDALANGVYRCTAAGGDVICRKARLID